MSPPIPPSSPDPGSPEQMKATLDELHAELQRATALDAEARRKLEHLAADIRRVLEEDAGRARESHAIHAPNLEEAAVRFEQDHPQLAATLRQVADALSRVGL